MALFAALLAGLVAGDRLDAVAALGVPTMQPRFADVRPITGARDSLAQGLDPLEHNPGDPWGRALNYPRLWLLPARLGLGPEHSEALALAFLAVFVVGLCWLTPLATTGPRTLALAAALFAPVTWLAVERANSDLVLFALLAAGAWLASRRPVLAAGAIALGILLKLYPVFALGSLLGQERRRALLMAGVVALSGGYLLWLGDDLATIHRHSLAWNRISYGITQLPDALAANTGASPGLLRAGAGLAFAAIAGVALRARGRWHLPAPAGPTLAAFRSGAGVFLGTFCLGSNFDYRLLALLLVVPQVVAWCGRARGPLLAAMGSLMALLLLLLWSMTWRQGLAALLGSETPGLVLDEVVTWALVALLLVALSLGLPAWLRPSWPHARPLLGECP
ncbi:MAG: DUF2029 domain-containing protein [Planctomycetes bacterium]|nr:DUF2029 domain-containing protein [Planctomycetota bacterium]